jgi:arabinogalactan oligomer / maltooligosaccharide transport system substrate-binding protein
MPQPGDSPRQRSGPPSDPADQSGTQSNGTPKPQSNNTSKWDWRFLSNLLIPTVITVLIGTIGFGLWQLHAQNKSNQQLSQSQHSSDQKLSQDQQRATILQTYLNNMQDLLVTDGLATSAPGAEVRQVARVQTLATLGSLDQGRNKIVLQFLQNAHLVGTQDSVITLSDADLSKDDLSGADLSGVNLNGANLSSATLSDANLDDANLYDADLSNADLSGANLSDAVLTGAFLGSAIMNHAALTGANLSGAIMTGAHLNDAHMSGADLNGAELASADLSGTDVSDADLVSASLTQSQLDTVSSCTNAALSMSLKCHHIVKINLVYWYTETSAEARVIHTLIQQFEDNNKEIHIIPEPMNYFQTETAFENAVKEGDPPDVLRSDVTWVAQFASQGYLLNLDSYASQIDLSGYLPAALSYDYYQRNLYGLPQVTDFLALLYNKADLQKAVDTTSPPATMTELEADAMAVVTSGAAKYGFETDGKAYDNLPFIYAFGGGMLDTNHNILVNDAGSVAGLNFLLSLQDAGVMPADVNYSNGPVPVPVTDFMEGKTAMIFGGPYDIPTILKDPSFGNNPDNLGIAAIPAGPATTPTSTCPAGQDLAPSGGQSYVISASTLHPIEAEKFIAFMSQMTSQVAIAEKNQTLPTLTSAYPAVRGEQFINEFDNYTCTAVTQPVIPQAALLYEAFDPAIEAVLDDVESPAVALNAVADAWKQLLAGS